VNCADLGWFGKMPMTSSDVIMFIGI